MKRKQNHFFPFIWFKQRRWNFICIIILMYSSVSGYTASVKNASHILFRWITFKISQIQLYSHRSPGPIPHCFLLPYYYLTAFLPEGTVNILPTAIPTIVSRQKKLRSLLHTKWIKIFWISQEIGELKGGVDGGWLWGKKKLP